MSAKKKKNTLIDCPRCGNYFLNRDMEKHPENCEISDSAVYIRPEVCVRAQSSLLDTHSTHLPSDAFGWSRNHTVLMNGDTIELLGVLPRSPCLMSCGEERFLVTIWPCAELSLLQISAPRLVRANQLVDLEVVRDSSELRHLQLTTNSDVDHRLLESSHFVHYLRLYLSESFVSPSFPLVVKYLARDLVFEIHEDEAECLSRCKLNESKPMVPIYSLSEFTISFAEGLR